MFSALRFFLCSSRAKPCYVPMNSIVSIDEATFSDISLLNFASIYALSNLRRAFGEILELLFDFGRIEGSFSKEGANYSFL